jgi:hypothetical protein
MQRILLLAAAAIFGQHVLVAAETGTTKEKQTPEQWYQVGKIRVFYRTEGVHAVNAADVNHNGVPDQVEDIATQTKAAYLLFVETLGFPDPFETERYRGAAFLDITVRSKEVLGSSGKAYDELQRFNRPGDPANTARLSFSVATTVQPASNLTPSHEFFHLIQYSVTYFKNRWFTEGTARWSERSLGLGALGPVRHNGDLPLSGTRRYALFGMAYEASEYFWNPLLLKEDPEDAIPESKVSAELRQLTYVDGSKVLKDLQFTGWRLMRVVLREMDKADDVAFREQKFERWSEENQKAEGNNTYILQAVVDAVSARKGAN